MSGPMVKEECFWRRRRVLLSFKKSSAALLVSGLVSIGCGSTEENVELEVYTWWEQRSENFAFDKVITLHKERTGVTVGIRPDGDATAVRDNLSQFLLTRRPPATFQANVGADLLRWTMVDKVEPDDAIGDAVESARYVEELASLFARNNLTGQLFRELYDALRVNGRGAPYAVPINVHRLNTLYYNVESLEAFRAANDSRSFLEIETLCPADRSVALDIPVAMATSEGFTLTLLAFENILPALSGAKFYNALFRGELWNAEDTAAWIGQVRQALECVQYLSRSFLQPTSWSAAVEAVVEGRAAFTVMGDWANADILDELDAGLVRAVPFPSTERIFVFTSDSFPLPIGVQHRAEVEDLLRTMASPEAQYAFSEFKGSIPARNDVNVAGLAAVQREARFAFENSERVLATSGLFPPYYPLAAVDLKLREMTRDGAGEAEVDAALAEFIRTVPLLVRWQARLAEPPAPAVDP